MNTEIHVCNTVRHAFILNVIFRLTDVFFGIWIQLKMINIFNKIVHLAPKLLHYITFAIGYFKGEQGVAV